MSAANQAKLVRGTALDRREPLTQLRVSSKLLTLRNHLPMGEGYPESFWVRMRCQQILNRLY